jgi:hypothetical protein
MDELVRQFFEEEPVVANEPVAEPRPAKKGGRKVIPALYVDSSRRLVIFCKRKGGLQSKASQLTGRTGSNVLLLIQQVPSDDSMNNYAYADPTWRTSLFSDAMRMMLSEPHSLRDASTSNVYAPSDPYVNPFEDVPESTIESIPIYDTDDKLGVRRSESQDAYCRITYGAKTRRSRARSDDAPAASSGFFFCNEDPEQEAEPCREDMADLDQAEKELDALLQSIEAGPTQGAAAPRKKRGAVCVGYTKDPRKRGQTHAKRIEGIMNKAFELSALSGCHCLLVASSPSSAPPGIREGTAIPSTYYVFASPAWRASPAFVGLMRLLRLAQETDYWAPRFFAKERSTEVPPVNLFIDALGYADEYPSALEQAKKHHGYMFPPQAGSIKMQAIKKSDDAGVSFTWRTSILPLSEATLCSRKRRVADGKRGRPLSKAQQHKKARDDIVEENICAEGSPAIRRSTMCVTVDGTDPAGRRLEVSHRIPISASESCEHLDAAEEASVIGRGFIPRASSIYDFDMTAAIAVEPEAIVIEEPPRPVYKPPALADRATIKSIVGERTLKRSVRGLDLLL